MFFKRKNEPTFVETLLEFCRTAPDDCVLRAPLKERDIEEIGRALQVQLPRELAELLGHSNGVDLFDGDLVIYGKHIGSPPYEVGDLVKETTELRRLGLVSDQSVVFGQRSSGTMFIAQSRRPVVSVVDPSGLVSMREFDSFVEWWRYEIQHWSEVIDGGH